MDYTDFVQPHYITDDTVQVITSAFLAIQSILSVLIK